MNAVNRTIIANEIKLMFFIGLSITAILFLGYIITEIFGLGMTGIMATMVIAVGMNLFSYFFSKDIVLKSQGAIRMREEEFGEYINNVKRMCENNNIRLPELYYINSSALNAFATGRNQKNAAVVVTKGLLQNVPMDEIMGVVGHELSHIIHKDIMVTSFIGTMLGCITIMASFIRNASIYRSGYNNRNSNSSSMLALVAILASVVTPIAATLIKMAVSRSREYMADATGGQICGNPMLLAKALYRISHDGSEMPCANSAVAPLYISNPLRNNIFTNLFSTHPNTEDRIRRLEKMNFNG